jgi:uncharacterized protein
LPSSYLYLHGFASSPRSHKAQYLHDRFQELNQPLLTPDLNQDDFFHLTLTRQIKQVQSLLPTHGVTLLGSSFGGLTAAWVAQLCPQVERLILIAPAFGFLDHWLPRLTPPQRQELEQTRSLSTYHYGEQQLLPISSEFITDFHRYSDTELTRSIPTLILHGVDDEVIPIAASQAYASERPWVSLIGLEGDHGLLAQEPEIWQQVSRFCNFN